MAEVHVHHTLGDLIAKCADIAEAPATDGRAVVRDSVREGNKIAREIAKAASGRHGKDYFKRISWEMTGPLEGEFGPHDGGLPVGGGWRHGAGNRDMPRAADAIGPKFADSVDEMVSGWFW